MSLPDDITEAHKMIEELRKENADRRVRAKPYEEAFKLFNQEEQEFVLGLVSTLAADPQAGALALRDLSYQMLDPADFVEGLELDLPAPTTPTESTEEEESDMPGLTAEQLQAELDRRETAAREAAEKAAEEAAIEAIYDEIEEAGFPRGSEGFQIALSLAAGQAQLGKDVDFKALAPTVASVVGVELPSAEGETAEEEEEAGTGTKHVSTALVSGSSGAPGEAPKDWLAEAKAAGRDPFEVARERAEARLELA